MSREISAIINSFFVRYSQEFRQGKLEAFEIIMALAMSHAYGCCNPKQWADYLGIQPQKVYILNVLTEYALSFNIGQVYDPN
ncbi:MAG: hypothetical protein QNJ55_29115 [Xenococcus sp. MO_188.B8]|nr:hypothetical protein [Xenococcus sp. MO_188.B8]